MYFLTPITYYEQLDHVSTHPEHNSPVWRVSPSHVVGHVAHTLHATSHHHLLRPTHQSLAGLHDCLHATCAHLEARISSLSVYERFCSYAYVTVLT